MKKILFILLIINSQFLIIHCQTALPTSWSFNGSGPVGWTTYNTGLFATYAHTAPACRLAATGSYVQIYFEYAVLGQNLLELLCDQDLFEFAQYASLRR